MPSRVTARFALHLLTTCLVCAGVGAGRAQAPPPQSSPQQPAQEPVFKGRIDLVRTDVAVIDNRTGTPVTGLSERDFTIAENGVRQTIAMFADESSGSFSRKLEGGVREAPTSRNRRVFLIMLGSGRLDGPVNPFDGVLRFLRERLRPDDLVAVMALNRATAFTTDHEQIIRAVERMKLQLLRVKYEIADEHKRNFFKNLDISPGTQAHIDAMFRTPGAADDTMGNVTTMLLGSRELRQNESRWRPWNREVAYWDLLKVFAGIDYLRGMEGEKHLICLTLAGIGPPPVRFINGPVGLALDSGEGDRPVIVRANDAHVALDIIHTEGTFRGINEAAMTSQNISAQTGGQFTSLRTADAQLARIDEVTRSGYILGYVPRNPALDGKYRNVTVTVNRKDVTVVYRRGYTARAEPPPIDVREIVTRQRLRDAATTDIAQDDIRVEATAVALTGAARRLRVELTIDPSRLTLTPSGATREGTIDLMILCGDAKQNVVGRLDQQMTLGLDEAHYAQVMKGGIPYTAVIPITGTATRVKVLVYDYPSDRLGAANVIVK